MTSSSQALRKSSWYGAKRVAARILTLPVVRNAVHFAGRRVLRAKDLHRLPVSARSALYRSDNGPVTLLNPLEDQVAKDLFWGEGKPTSRADALVLELVERLSKNVELFLDIGSYSGLFALIAARSNPQLHAVAYEIMPENYLMIAANIIENDLVGRVEVKHLGLADAPGAITMPAHTSSVARPSSMSLSERFEEGIRVPVSTLDAEGHGGPMLLKIDVEGFEWNVIQGGKETIRKHRPDIICEFLRSSKDGTAVGAFLKPIGYRFFIALDRGFEERDDIVPTAEAKDWVLTTTNL